MQAASNQPSFDVQPAKKSRTATTIIRFTNVSLVREIKQLDSSIKRGIVKDDLWVADGKVSLAGNGHVTSLLVDH